MLKEKQLNNDLTSLPTDTVCTAADLKERLERVGEENELPLTILQDTIKVGGMFNSRELECVVISHPEHLRDYYQIVAIPGNGEVLAATTGTSKQMKKFSIAERAKEQRRGKSLSFKIGHMATSSLFLIGKSKDKLAAEQDYYDAVLSAVAMCLVEE